MCPFAVFRGKSHKIAEFGRVDIGARRIVMLSEEGGRLTSSASVTDACVYLVSDLRCKYAIAVPLFTLLDDHIYYHLLTRCKWHFGAVLYDTSMSAGKHYSFRHQPYEKGRSEKRPSEISKRRLQAR
jgi:hypothetical protein